MVTPWVHWPVSWAEAATVSLGSGIRSLSPVSSEVEFAGLERERISDCSAKHDLSGAEASDGAGVVPVHEDSLDNLVGVESPSLRGISSDQPLGVLDGQLGSLDCKPWTLCGRFPTVSRNPRKVLM